MFIKRVFTMFAIALMLVMILPVAPAQAGAQSIPQAASLGCPPFFPGRMHDKEFLLSLPVECLDLYQNIQVGNSAIMAAPAPKAYR